MREILFRGKTIDGSGWVTDSETYIRDADGVWLSDGSAGVVKVVPETVGQFTGLTDKNGKRIFEGDVVRAIDGALRSVVYVGGAFWTFASDTVYGLMVNWRGCSGVVGNVHDNPELMGGEE